MIYQLSEICARNIWFQILLTNEVVNVAVTRSQSHLRAGLEPAALTSENSLSVWNEKKLLHVPWDSAYPKPYAVGKNNR